MELLTTLITQRKKSSLSKNFDHHERPCIPDFSEPASKQSSNAERQLLAKVNFRNVSIAVRDVYLVSGSETTRFVGVLGQQGA